MTNRYVLRLIEDALAPGRPAVTHAWPCNRVLYAVEGAAALADRQGERQLATDRALRTEGALTVSASEGARLWRFELLPAAAPDDGRIAGPGMRSEIKLAAEVALPEPTPTCCAPTGSIFRSAPSRPSTPTLARESAVFCPARSTPRSAICAPSTAPARRGSSAAPTR